MAGELMVSGIQLAREYLHNPEKTAASFIPNPHNHDSNPNHTRVYRTGMPSPLSCSEKTLCNTEDVLPPLLPWDPREAQTDQHGAPVGDLARWLPNGNIEFLGRLDDQVLIAPGRWFTYERFAAAFMFCSTFSRYL